MSRLDIVIIDFQLKVSFRISPPDVRYDAFYDTPTYSTASVVESTVYQTTTALSTSRFPSCVSDQYFRLFSTLSANLFKLLMSRLLISRLLITASPKEIQQLYREGWFHIENCVALLIALYQFLSSRRVHVGFVEYNNQVSTFGSERQIY